MNTERRKQRKFLNFYFLQITTMNVYAHSTRKAKRESAKLLDKVAGND